MNKKSVTFRKARHAVSRDGIVPFNISKRYPAVLVFVLVFVHQNTPSSRCFTKNQPKVIKSKNPCKSTTYRGENGSSSRIRTCDQLVNRQSFLSKFKAFSQKLQKLWRFLWRFTLFPVTKRSIVTLIVKRGGDYGFRDAL